jgi:ketosteroid isomerase-like protein
MLAWILGVVNPEPPGRGRRAAHSVYSVSTQIRWAGTPEAPMRYTLATLAALVAALALAPAGAEVKPDLNRQVFAAESSFARTMAVRDHRAFGEFVSAEAVFFGRRGAMRGREAVMEGWKALFVGPKPPFSWRPEVVEVLDSGTLALSSGPVLGPDGKLIGKFNSVWRLEPDGRWRVVFDKGCPVCDSTRTE